MSGRRKRRRGRGEEEMIAEEKGRRKREEGKWETGDNHREKGEARERKK